MVLFLIQWILIIVQHSAFCRINFASVVSRTNTPIAIPQSSYRSVKTGKGHEICVIRERSGKNIVFEKSGKMLLDHANCRYL